jgi:SsrA-binding protein
MYSKVTKDGITLVCTKLYFNDKNMVKVEVATAKGRKLHDKREVLKEKTLKRESEQAVKSYK